MVFERRHYIRICEIIRKQPQGDTKLKLCDDFSSFFKEDNPNFNPDKFKDCVFKDEW